MLVITVNKKEKHIPSQWEEMTIDFYCGLYQIINKYKRTEEQEDNDKEKNLEKFYFSQETKMYKEIFSYMTETPLEDVEKANMEDVLAVINSLDNIMQEYKPKGIDSFMFEGEKYYFPFEFLKTSTFGEYIEANQLELSTQYLKNGRFDILPEQMAILCKMPSSLRTNRSPMGKYYTQLQVTIRFMSSVRPHTFLIQIIIQIHPLKHPS